MGQEHRAEREQQRQLVKAAICATRRRAAQIDPRRTLSR
jgi:hypothetical protein